MSRSGAAAVAVAVVLAVVGCTTAEPPASSGSTETSAVAGTPSPESSVSVSPSPAATGPHREVEFPAADGEPVAGRFFDGRDAGSGAREAATVGVVLSHMGRSVDGPDDWQAYAESLADRGYLVLTYTERGQYDEIWNDVLGGVSYLRDEGATTVIAAGASIGAMASLYAASEREASGIDAVLWLAGVLNSSGYAFEEKGVEGLDCPVLIVAGEDDTYGAGSDAETLHGWTSGFSELLLLPSRYHGTDILTLERPRTARKLRRAMDDFVDRVAEERPGECTAG
ncbi:hypothetical protein [Promicromonospora sp. NPDC023987]|uniref:alpha/beta hydrolase n=1 Tax=Promicromonospora sp. NPDC023987 TaxID=3155360 RepID=UPI00340CED95